MEPSLSTEEGDKATEITMKDFRKALSTAKGDSKLLIEAEVDYGYQKKPARSERNNAIW
ncbi:MAG: hypothetical protein ACRCYP_00940 [Alphaproteobacteria bacterium]